MLPVPRMVCPAPLVMPLAPLIPYQRYALSRELATAFRTSDPVPDINSEPLDVMRVPLVPTPSLTVIVRLFVIDAGDRITPFAIWRLPPPVGRISAPIV